MNLLTKVLAAPAVLAAVSLAALPASAAELPVASHIEVTPVAHGYGPYVSTGIGWGSGWGWGGDRYRRHRGSTAGDILTGVLILGTIAAVASAASKANDRRNYPVRYPYPERRGDYRMDGPQGLQGAADMCLREVERNARAREVTRVERSAGGWLVTGAMADGSAFSCSIGADGRIDRVDVGGRSQSYGDADRQRADDTYRSARADAESGATPTYPGGPLPGDAPDERPEAPSPES